MTRRLLSVWLPHSAPCSGAAQASRILCCRHLQADAHVLIWTGKEARYWKPSYIDFSKDEPKRGRFKDDEKKSKVDLWMKSTMRPKE